MLLSERRALQKQKAQKREIEKFLAPVFVIDRGIWLQSRSQYIYACRRLGILHQMRNPEVAEIARLEKLREVVLREIPNIAEGLTEFDLCPTKNEI